jgi:hypothetical protein
MTPPEKDGWILTLLLELGRTVFIAWTAFLLLGFIRSAVYFGATDLEAGFTVLMAFLYYLFKLWGKITDAREVALFKRLDELLENQRELSREQH